MTKQTIYDLLENLDKSKAYNLTTRKVKKDDGKETVQFTADFTTTKDKNGKVEITIANDAKWFSGNCVETLTMRSREFDHLKLGIYDVLDSEGKSTGDTEGHGYDKQYRFFVENEETKKDGTVKTISKDEYDALALIRGKFAAIRIRLDALLLKETMERVMANGKVHLESGVVESLCDSVAKTIVEGCDILRKVKKDTSGIIIY